MILDAHHHVWTLARGDYGWLTPEMSAFYRDFDLADYIAAAPFVDASILVQAAPTDAETDFLLSLAGGSDRVAGVVGWVDLASPAAPKRLARLAARPRFLGVRPMLQDLEDPDWIARDDLTPALRALTEMDLSFDALVRAVHLPVLVIHGRRDPIPVASAEAVAQSLGAPLVLLDDCGHVPYIEQPQALFSAIARFLT